ncbi:TPA: AbrB/MazE/SpoVT family DNA-binding domain-containing protein [Yersinia enterocolitica]
MVQVIVKKWGNIPSVRLPLAVVEAVNLKINDTVDVTVKDGCIMIIPAQIPKITVQR